MKEIFLIISPLIGFFVSFYIFYSKKHEKPMHCMIGKDCNAVVTSDYGKTFGVENTIPGMAYYLIIIIYAAGLILNQNVFKENIVYYLIVSASIASVLFAAYLTLVQAFVLKKWCEYCLISSLASLSILIVLI